MGAVESLSTLIGTWFGYVGACVAAPEATCRPFLAFLALGTAAVAALALVLMAYRAARRREMTEIEEQRAHTHGLEVQERVRRALAEPATGIGTGPKPALQGRLRVAA